MFIAGTRSLPVNQTDTSWSAYYQDPIPPYGIAAGNPILTFYIPNAFPTNASGTNAVNAYMRVKHPKIPDTDYIVMVGVFDSPLPAANSPSQFKLPLFKYSSLSNGGTLSGIDGQTDYGLAAGDILDIYYPNKYYNSTFPGDPTFTNDKFIRFSYRFKFNDGEYSLLAPFSQSVFIPKQNGYFQKRVGNAEYNSSENNLVPQEQIAGQNTIVDFFTNSITEAKVKIPLDFSANELKDKLKVDEIDVIYKESDGLSLKVAQTIDVDTLVSTDNFVEYKYQSRKPIKTLPSDEIGRVYDNVPIRALTQSTSGNRIIYGNFVDRHTSPLSLDYMVGFGRKFMPSTKESQALYNQATVAYPTHTVKHNRSYQVGIVMSDRYGRSSDVILSNIDNTSIVDTSFPGNAITFGGSTVYIPYDIDMEKPLTLLPSDPIGNIKNTKSPVAGIIDWPGDALKLRWNTAIPNTITSNPGYPGLYEEVITSLQFDNTAGSTWSITTASEVTKAAGVQPGMYMRWVISNVTYETEVKGVTDNSPTSYTIEPVSTANPPTASSTRVVFYKKNPLGFSSYRVVVKQNEQDYYNVYLPSLLDGNPVVKPFKLNVAITAEGVGTVNSTTDLPAAPPKTFLLLEGMVFTSAAGTEYVITNILNNDHFTVEPATVLAAEDVEFTTRSSKNTLNVATLLTDNANKVPPALIETTPVQQQYGTSDVKLIPRVALQANYTGSGAPFFSTGVDRNRYIYPGVDALKVRSLGNFEGLFVDGSYAGLWQADTDPPTAVIENKFQLGKNSIGALPASKEALIFSCYETTPTISEIDIYFETSTSFDIYTLNEKFSL